MFTNLKAHVQSLTLSLKPGRNWRNWLPVWYGAALLLVALLFFAPVGLPVVHAATFTVNSLDDTSDNDTRDGICRDNSNNCTLRGAIQQANALPGADIIQFSVNGIIYPRLDLPTITDSLTITGKDHSITIDGKQTIGIFTVNNISYNIDVSLEYLTLTHGSVSTWNGAALYIRHARRVDISNVSFTNNIVNSNNGGAIGNDYSFLTITDSYFSNNRAQDLTKQIETEGGAIYTANPTVIYNTTFVSNVAGSKGGAISSTSTFSIVNSTIDNNTAGAQGNINTPSRGAGMYIFGGTANILNTTISNNLSRNFGGGLYIDHGTVTLVNSTVSTNEADEPNYNAGGGFFNDQGTLNLVNSTVTNNILTSFLGDNSTTTMTNSILGDTIGGTGYIGKAPVDNGGNIIGDAKLGPLQNNGGPTRTHMPLISSPAIDNGLDNVCAAAPPGGAGGLDQRGKTRPTGFHCDSGAVEFDGFFVINTLQDTNDSNFGDGLCKDINNKCSLRAAIQEANNTPGDNLVQFDLSGTITLGSNLTSIYSTNTSGGLIIDGVGQKVELNGNDTYRGFAVNGGANFTLRNLQVRNAYDPNAGAALTIFSGATTTLVNTTFLHNRTSDSNTGGAIYNGGTLTINNSTFSSNHSGSGGAIYNYNGNLTLYNVTIADNEAVSYAGAIFTQNGNMSVFNSIITRNINPSSSAEIINPYTDGGGNLIGTNARLGSLQDNGGPTPTYALLSGSPAIDNGITGANVFSTDQRGQARVGKPDSGAYEAPATTLKTLIVSPTSATILAGQTQQYAASGVFAGSSSATNVTTNAGLSWSSSNTAVATVSNAAGTKGQASGVGNGSASITAGYDGLNASATLTVNQTGTTTGLTVSPASSAPLGQAVTMTATVTPAIAGLSVDFLNGATVLGTAPTNASGQAVFATNSLATGSYSLTARFNGNTTYSASQSSPPVMLGITKIMTSSKVENASGNYGGSTTFTATLSANGSGLSGQVITFKLNGAAICGENGQPGCPQTATDGIATLENASLDGINAGTYNGGISAEFAGNATYNSATGNGNLTVNQLQTSLELSSTPNPSNAGQSVTFKVTISPAEASGTVTFINTADSSVLGTASLVNGIATVTLSNLPVGTKTVQAKYGGEINYAAASSNLIAQVVGLNSSSLTLTSDPNPTTVGQTVFFTATVSPASASGTVTFTNTADNSTLGTVAVTNGKATFSTASLPVGTTNIEAVYGGDATYGGSVSNTVSQVVIAECDPLLVTDSQDNGDESKCGTFSFALKTARDRASAVNPATITFAAAVTQITFSGPLNQNVGPYITIDGSNSEVVNGPGVTLDGNFQSGDGLKLDGHNTLIKLTIQHFGGREIVANQPGNKLVHLRVIG